MKAASSQAELNPEEPRDAEEAAFLRRRGKWVDPRLVLPGFRYLQLRKAGVPKTEAKRRLSAELDVMARRPAPLFKTIR